MVLLQNITWFQILNESVLYTDLVYYGWFVLVTKYLLMEYLSSFV